MLKKFASWKPCGFAAIVHWFVRNDRNYRPRRPFIASEWFFIEGKLQSIGTEPGTGKYRAILLVSSKVIDPSLLT